MVILCPYGTAVKQLKPGGTQNLDAYCRRSVENQPVVVELKPATFLVLNGSELIWQERILSGVS